MRPEEFVAKWRNVQFGEKQASQEMFLDICALAGHDTPVAFGNPEVFTFEKWVPGGFADAYYEEHFGWEFKGDDANLDAGLNQLLRYQVHLKTPPLLIVSSFRTIRIQTNFPGMETVRHEIPVASLEQRENLDKLRRVFHSPADFRPNRTLDAVTKDTADLFHAIVLDMERGSADPSASSGERLARYLNQIMFCLYAEDAGLLPGGLFTQIVRNHFHNPQLFDRAVRGLFQQMAGGGLFGADEVAHFNGDLFNTTDTVEFSLNALYLLNQAAEKDWRNIEPSIFGTLFERALDASKRSQLGAHYTGADDIGLVVEPVVMEPLRREWAAAEEEVNRLISSGDEIAARERLEAFQHRLASVRVLDPACGSGNFLYIALRSLLDLEQSPPREPSYLPEVMSWGRQQGPHFGNRAVFFQVLAYVDDSDTGAVEIDQQTIADDLGVTRQTVSSGMRRAEDKGLVDIREVRNEYGMVVTTRYVFVGVRGGWRVMHLLTKDEQSQRKDIVIAALVEQLREAGIEPDPAHVEFLNARERVTNTSDHIGSSDYYQGRNTNHPPDNEYLSHPRRHVKKFNMVDSDATDDPRIKEVASFVDAHLHEICGSEPGQIYSGRGKAIELLSEKGEFEIWQRRLHRGRSCGKCGTEPVGTSKYREDYVAHHTRSWTGVADPDPEAERIWQAVLERMREELPRPTYETWVKPTQGLAIEGETFTVLTPTPFSAEWLERRMYRALMGELEKAAGRPMELKFTVKAEGSLSSEGLDET